MELGLKGCVISNSKISVIIVGKISDNCLNDLPF